MTVFNKGLFCFLLLIVQIAYAQEGRMRLSPLPDIVEGLPAGRISLNGEWEMRVGDGGKPGRIKVPGEWEMQGYTVNEGETALYSRELDVPETWMGQRVKLRFEGVSSHAVVFVNDVRMGEHEGGFVPWELDITQAVHAGANRLRVEVQALTISDRLACTSQYAAHTVGGLLRNVTVFVLPDRNISEEVTETRFDEAYKDAVLDIRTVVVHESVRTGVAPPRAGRLSRDAGRLTLKYALQDREGRVVMERKATVGVAGGSTGDAHVLISVRHPRHWDPEHPYLYRLVTSLYEKGRLLERISRVIGFRQVRVQGNLLLVNGRPVKLHGVNRHSIYPLTGRSVSEDLDRKDAELFRAANCNYIRTSHYPPTEAFLDACDSLGLFVEDESALCWIQHGAAPIWRKWDYRDEKFLYWMIQANVEKVAAQRHHPSVIIWSLGNESVWSPLWARVNDTVKALDPSRPTTFHDQCWGGYNNAGSRADIAVYHYPDMQGPEACDTMRRPVLFGEYAHVSCYSRRELITDPGVREAYGPPLVRMYDSMYRHAGCLGGAIWAGIDDIFHMPDGRILGYGPWGPLDAWRRPKPEYFGMKKAYSPVVITGVTRPLEGRASLVLNVENRYDFTDLSEVGIRCDIDGRVSDIKVHLPPHGRGEITIPVGAGARGVRLVFTDPRGFVADSERLSLPVVHEDPVAPAEPVAHADPVARVNLSVTEDEAAVKIQQGSVEFIISRLTGVINGARSQGRTLLTQGPVFAVVPMNHEDGGKPNVAGETYQNNIYPLKDYPLYTLFANHPEVSQAGDSIVVSMEALYNHGSKGRLTYSFFTDGTVAVSYEIQYRGTDTLPRQYGMLMQLPMDMDKLSWRRRGDLNAYPRYDIGREDGTAIMGARQLCAVEEWGVVPQVAWKDDANQLGTADFRSTKRNIYEAALTDSTGTGVEVISDGTQAVRTWLQDQRVQLLIADYNNNGSEPFYVSPHSLGRINIKNKTLRGRIVFRIKQRP